MERCFWIVQYSGLCNICGRFYINKRTQDILSVRRYLVNFLRRKMYFDILHDDIGDIIFTTSDEGLTGVYLPGQEDFILLDGMVRASNHCIEQAKIEIKEYLNGNRLHFTVEVDLIGSEFQIKVWRALRNIPYAQTVSYKDIANALGMRGGYQAIGRANGKNPLAIIIPCHRVVGINGKLVGYAGGIELKRTLLTLEKNTKESRISRTSVQLVTE